MKIQWFCGLMALGLILSLCSCGKAGPLSGDSPQREADFSQTAEGETAAPGAPGELSLLYHMQRQLAKSYTEDGYYYLTLEEERLAGGQDVRHLMYMDFAARQEIYLCGDPACSHNTLDCTSVLPSEDFGHSTALFVLNGSLYLLSKEQDHDGSAERNVLSASSGTAPEAAPTVLYRSALDGTRREKIYAFDPSFTVEDLVLGDGDGLYLIRKKVTTEQGSGFTYQTSSQRELCRLDLSTGKESALLSMDLGGGIDWDVIGCTGRKLVLYGIDFGQEISAEEKHTGDRSLYDRSFDVFATLDVDSGSLREIYRVKAPGSRSYEVDGERLYYSVNGDGQIFCIDLLTAEQRTLCATQQDCIWGMVGDRLYTRSEKDSTFTFIDTKTGEISPCGLVDRSTGASLKIIAETGGQVLAIYDSDVTPRSDGSFTVHGYKYGLIRKEDLFAGRDAFAPIQMLGSGL